MPRDAHVHENAPLPSQFPITFLPVLYSPRLFGQGTACLFAACVHPIIKAPSSISQAQLVCETHVLTYTWWLWFTVFGCTAQQHLMADTLQRALQRLNDALLPKQQQATGDLITSNGAGDPQHPVQAAAPCVESGPLWQPTCGLDNIQPDQPTGPQQLTPVKRGRGRPKKTPVLQQGTPPVHSSTAHADHTAAQKAAQASPSTSTAPHASTSCSTDLAPDNSHIPLKRGPGRPRKHPEQTAPASGSVKPDASTALNSGSYGIPLKRKPGRPPKNPVQTAVVVNHQSAEVHRDSVESDTPKRKPGRPRKSPLQAAAATGHITKQADHVSGDAEPVVGQQSSSHADITTDGSEPPVKRKRGRPRKHSVPGTDSQTIAAGTAAHGNSLSAAASFKDWVHHQHMVAAAGTAPAAWLPPGHDSKQTSASMPNSTYPSSSTSDDTAADGSAWWLPQPQPSLDDDHVEYRPSAPLAEALSCALCKDLLKEAMCATECGHCCKCPGFGQTISKCRQMHAAVTFGYMQLALQEWFQG